MIRCTITASALFLAMSASGEGAWAEEAARRDSADLMSNHSFDHQKVISLHPDWTQRWEGRRCWITTPKHGEHLAVWFRPGNDATSGNPAVLLNDFIPHFIATTSSPAKLGFFAAERVIGRGLSPSGNALTGVALLAPTASGTLILASLGTDADLPGRFREVTVMSTFV